MTPCPHGVVAGGNGDGELGGQMCTGEWSGGTGVRRAVDTDAFIRPRRPLTAGCADARMGRGERGRYPGLKNRCVFC